ncbi:Peptidylprolyl isomerase [Musa troglodytarum]|uniref:peptidylprolyl isomerase n=1 Tax=Musa troglodytarum TaxID=320322 RepID=A0A9E7GRN2_9LILI|nr:Peptidylprolyl isomerase [Musa troglodytarum]
MRSNPTTGREGPLELSRTPYLLSSCPWLHLPPLYLRRIRGDRISPRCPNPCTAVMEEEDLDLSGGEEEPAMMDPPDDGPALRVGVGEEKEVGKQGLKKKLVKEGSGWEMKSKCTTLGLCSTGPSSIRAVIGGRRSNSSSAKVGSQLHRFVASSRFPVSGRNMDLVLLNRHQYYQRSNYELFQSFSSCIFIVLPAKAGCPAYVIKTLLKFETVRTKNHQGQVIKGWDQGIKTMKKGENAIFTIPPELAYGQSEVLTFSISSVTYEAWLEDGTVISKSEGVEFTVKNGFFCPALAKSVKTMKKAEKVLLTVKPQYAFGEKGRPASGDEGAVPPNATLYIELELISWKTVTEIGDDRKIIKKTLKEGEGYQKPNEGAVVTVKLLGKLQDGTVFVKKGHDEQEPFEFKTDEEQVIEGLDRAVMSMKKGEIALVAIPPEYAFSFTESKQELAVVPANSTVIYEEKESWDMNTAEKIEAAGKKKEEGNALFKLGKYARASKRYEKGAKFIEYDNSFSEEEKKQSRALKAICNLNNAACKLKLNDYKEAEKLCSKVLEVDTRNVKALYRRAQAYIQLADLDLAELDVKKALEIDPDNRDVKLEYKSLKEKMREYNKKDAKFYGNIFAKMSK